MRLTSEYLILSSYLYWGPGAFFPIFSFLVSSLTKILEPSQRLAWVKLYLAAVFSTERGNLPNEVCACSESRACARAVKSINLNRKEIKSVRAYSIVNKRLFSRPIDSRFCFWWVKKSSGKPIQIHQNFIWIFLGRLWRNSPLQAALCFNKHSHYLQPYLRKVMATEILWDD